MAELSLVCVREDVQLADQLAAALERYGFSICRSATVFENFQGYAGVVILLSPASARSELVTTTAERAMDWGKLIPVFVSLCKVPDRLSGIALHDLSVWDGAAEDQVVAAIAGHAARLAGMGARPLGPAAPAPERRPPLSAQWLGDGGHSRRVRLTYAPPTARRPAPEPTPTAWPEPLYAPSAPDPAPTYHAAHFAADPYAQPRPAATASSLLTPIDEHVPDDRANPFDSFDDPPTYDQSRSRRRPRLSGL